MPLSVMLSTVLAFGVSIASAGSHYLGRKEAVNYQTAKERCQDFGGNLATFSNDNDYSHINSVRAQMGSVAWIGFDDIDNEGHWKMIDGDEDYCAPSQTASQGQDCDDIKEWASNEPNGNIWENCAELMTNGYLNDLDCSRWRYYICEFNKDTHKVSSSDLGVPNLPWIGAEPVPRRFVYGTYTAQDLMVLALAVFSVFNVATLAVCCLRTKGTATVRYAKVVADSDEDARLNA